MAAAYQTSTTGTFSGGSLSANPPSGLASGDCWVVVGCQDDDNLTAVAPSGWTLIDARFNTTWPNGFALCKPNCSGSEGAQSITLTGGSGGGLYHSIRVSGAHATNPLDAVNEFVGGSGNSIDAPDITVANADSLAILVAVQNTHGTWTPPSGTTEIADTTDGSSIKLGTAYEARNAGAYAPSTWLSSRIDGGLAALTFSIAPAAGGGGPTQYDQGVSGAIALAAVLSKRTSRSLSGAIATSGALVRRIGKALSASLGLAGALGSIKTALISLSGSIGLAGALVKRGRKSLAGSLSSAGAIVRQARALRSGTIATSGALLRRTSHALAGTIATSGALSAIKTALISLAGTIATAGVLVRRTGKSVSGSVVSSGSISRRVSHVLAGTLTLAGVVTRRTTRALAGAIALSGTLIGLIPTGAKIIGATAASLANRLGFGSGLRNRRSNKASLD